MAIITISRGTFSGGKELAENLARRLDYLCMGREDIVSEATKRYGISEEKLRAAVKDAPPFWQDRPGPRISYLKCLTATLLEYAREGNLVYHGYAGHLLLAGISHVLRVRVIASMEYRIKAAMELLSLDREKAIAYLDKIDRERKKWTRYLYGVDWQDPSLYDVVLNLDHISIPSASETIITMTKLDDFRVTPESQKAAADLFLSSKVWASLAKDHRTRVASIHVAADDGTVLVTGSVGSEKTVEAVLMVAKQVDGVKRIKNEIGIGSDWFW